MDFITNFDGIFLFLCSFHKFNSNANQVQKGIITYVAIYANFELGVGFQNDNFMVRVFQYACHMEDAIPKNNITQKRKNGKMTISKAKIDIKLIFKNECRSLKLWIIDNGPNPSLELMLTSM